MYWSVLDTTYKAVKKNTINICTWQSSPFRVTKGYTSGSIGLKLRLGRLQHQPEFFWYKPLLIANFNFKFQQYISKNTTNFEF